ncbi:ribonuclease H-like YkuK family protein [Wukongibacter baidiensis]|uniref:ribonuclease H-like YkuK family protein n=1 Tax=Wukongibacter baidiensis TaxID=1723361 RepID=UPI003D7FE4BE
MTNNNPYYLNTMVFSNSTTNHMTFDEAFNSILSFVQKDPVALYKLAIGTDSHVKSFTRFISAIHVHRIGLDGIGKGAWGCIKEYIIPRRISSLREKISIETSLTQELLFLFDYNRTSQIIDILIPHADKGANFILEAHIDIGRRGATRDLIQEMTGRITCMGVEAKIKPDSYAASSYADRYTK